MGCGVIPGEDAPALGIVRLAALVQAVLGENSGDELLAGLTGRQVEILHLVEVDMLTVAVDRPAFAPDFVAVSGGVLTVEERFHAVREADIPRAALVVLAHRVAGHPSDHPGDIGVAGEPADEAEDLDATA